MSTPISIWGPMADIDHGLLSGLGDDDHPQYLTVARGNARYASLGSGITDHGTLTGLADDDHPQYYNQARGDARYLQISAISSLTVIDPSLPPYNADKTGVADATSAFNAAFTAARAVGAEVRPSPGTYKINGSLDPQGTALRGPGVYRRDVTVYTGVGVVLLHNGSVPLFIPSADGWVVSGITIYDPNQLGTGAVPVVRPAIIEPTAPARLVDVTFENNVVINCYDFVHIPSGSLGGDCRFVGNRIYAIRYLFWLQAATPDVFFVANNMFSCGVYQTYAVFATPNMLQQWSCNNAVSWYIDMVTGTSDGIKSCNNIYFGIDAAFLINQGGLTVSTSTGDSFDAVNSVIRKQNTGTIAGFVMSGADIYSYVTGVHAGPPASVRTIPFEIGGSGNCSFSVTASRLEVSVGDWLVDTNTGTSQVDFDAFVGPWGTLSGLTGDAYGFYIDNPLATYTLHVRRLQTFYADGVGVATPSAADLIVSGCAFVTCKAAIDVRAGFPAGGRVHVVGCISRGTLGTHALLVDAGAVGSVTAEANRWDAAATVADA